MKKNTENPSQSLKHYSIVNTELSVEQYPAYLPLVT